MFVGIRHRVKKTADGEARPTQICVVDDQEVPTKYDLEDEQAELDWLLGIFPTIYRAADADDDLSSFREHHIKWKKLRKGQEIQSLVMRHLKGGSTEVAYVPDEYDGLKEGDRVGIVLSGSSNPLAYALSMRGDEIGATTHRLTTKLIKDKREELGRDKNDDALTLAELVRDQPEIFYPVTARDRDAIRLAEIYKQRQEIQRARIGCEQRMRQHLLGSTFLSKEGHYPQGSLDLLLKERKANDLIYQSLVEEEKARSKELEQAIEKYDVYREVFEAS